MILSRPFKNAVCYLLIVALLASQVVYVPKTQSAQSITRYSLVALLVDESLWKDTEKYAGLSNENQQISPATIKYRIERYAEEVQANLPYTKTAIFLTSPQEETIKISAVLEKLYREGDGTADEINSLAGVIMIGQLPLPVVRRGDYRFPSIYPYTDFDDKLYVLDESTNEFVLNENIKNPQVEAWHGIIAPPKKGKQGNEMLAEYFDKNHLFRIGEQKYSSFDEKIFYGDLIREKENLNKSSFIKYQNSEKYAEQKTYLRYTKELAQEIFKDVNKKALQTGDEQDNDSDGKIDEDPINGIDDDQDGEEGSPLHGLIDGIDNDGDGETDEDDEGYYGLCGGKFQNCAINVQKKTPDYYAVRADALYRVSDNKDNDGDGIVDEGIDEDDGDPYKNIDNDQDGKKDEDSQQMNDADKDGKTDEDGPGDMNNDGCPGQCLVDDDGDQADTDHDRFPDGAEREAKTDERDSSDYPSVGTFFSIKIPQLNPDPQRNNPHYLKPERKNWVDEYPSQSDKNCFDSQGKFHPEWDDDEDGKCDEDSSADNDNDKDGKIDEDKAEQDINISDDTFAKLPDIVSNTVIGNYLGELPELLPKYVGNLNKFTAYSGRWNRGRNNNVDDFSGIIAKRDTASREYLRLLNTVLEKTIDDVASKAQQSFPVVTGGRIHSVSVTILENGGNHRVKEYTPDVEFTSGSETHINGVAYDQIKSPLECSLFRGTSSKIAQASKMVLFNKIYNPLPPKDSDGNAINEIPDAGNWGFCIGAFNEFPGVCLPEKASKPLIDFVGARAEGKNDEWFPSMTDYRSCFDLKEKKFFDQISGGGNDLVSITPRTIEVKQPNGTIATKTVTEVKQIAKYQDMVRQYVEKKGQLEECLQKEKNSNVCSNIQVPAIPKEENRPIFTDKYKDLSKIIVFEDTEQKKNGLAALTLSLADISKALQLNEHDFNALSERLFNTKNSLQLTHSITIKNPFGSNDPVKEITLNMDNMKYAKQGAILGLGGQPVILSSLVKHKAPFSFEAKTQGNTLPPAYDSEWMILNQNSEHRGSDIAVDDPRYVSFLDKRGNYQKINYPNVFQAKSIAEIQLMVETTANKLANLTGDPADAKKITEALQKFTAPPKGFDLENEFASVVTQGSMTDNEFKQLKALFAESMGSLAEQIHWRQLNIDEKHQEVIKYTLSVHDDLERGIRWPQPSNNSIDNKRKSFKANLPFAPKDGYESAYIIFNGDSNELYYHINPAVPDGDEEEDPAFKFPQKTAQRSSKVEGESTGEDVVGIFLFKWFVHIIDWVKSLNYKPQVTLQCQFAGNDLIEEVKDAAEDIKKLQNAVPKTQPVVGRNNGDTNKDGIPDGAEKSVALAVIPEKTLLLADGSAQTKVFVETVDQNGKRNTLDGYTQVKLTIPSGDQYINIIGPDEGQIAGGRAEFVINSTEQPGSSEIKAFSINRDKRIESNNKKIITADLQLAVHSYLKPNLTPNRSDSEQAILEDVLVLETNTEEKIMRVRAQTGQIELLSSAYEISVEKSQGSSPLQVLLSKKSDKQKVAAVQYVPLTKEITLTDADFIIANRFAGVQVKPLSTAYQTQSTDDMIRIYDKEKLKSEINRYGQIFLDTDWSIMLNQTESQNEYQTFVILASNKTPVAEVFIAADNDTINIIDRESEVRSILSFNGLISKGKVTEKNKNSIQLIKPAHAQQINFDLDEDGLSDFEEFIIGTKPQSSDSDGDGVSDNAELIQNLNPLKKDEKLFIDLTADHEAYESIISLYKKGVIRGYADNTYKPDNPLTREEFVKVNMASSCIDCTRFSPAIQESVLKQYEPTAFPDGNITPELLYCVANGKNRGIVQGYSGGQIDGFFLPKRSISRAEATKVMLLTAGIEIPNNALTDKPWFYNYVIGAKQAQLYPQKRFDELDAQDVGKFKDWFNDQINNEGPFIDWINQPITRAEFAIMVARTIKINNCYNKDTDGDGLSNNSERLQYGTDENKADTDDGGVNDYREVIASMNPLDPSDDIAVLKTPEPQVTPPAKNSEEVLRTTDSDNDGLSDYDEINIFKTDPKNAFDGARNQEVTRAQGIHVIGYQVIHESVTIPGDSDLENLAETVRYTDEIPADGKSQIYVGAQLQNLEGETQFGVHNLNIRFKEAEGSEKFAKITGGTVKKMVDGKAETLLTTETKSGDFYIEAEVVGEDLPATVLPIHVFAGAPKRITFSAQSNQMKADGLSSIDMGVNLLDEFGNLADFSVYPVTITVEGPAKIDGLTDEDQNNPGVTTQVLGGKVGFKLRSTEQSGDITLTASVNAGDETVTRSTIISAVDTINTKIEARENKLIADGKTRTVITVTAVDKNNLPITTLNGKVSLTTSPQRRGTIVPSEIELKDGKGTAVFVSGIESGEVAIQSSSELLTAGQTKMTLTPDIKANHIKLFANKSRVDVDPKNRITVITKIYDENENILSDLNVGKATIAITQATKEFASLPKGNQVDIKNGMATFEVAPTGITGPINLVVRVDQLPQATISLQSVNMIRPEDFYAHPPNSMHITLLGTNAGAVDKEDYLAGAMVFGKGKTLAATTLISQPSRYETVASINRSGTVVIKNSAQLSTELLNTGEKAPDVLLIRNENNAIIGSLTAVSKKPFPLTITKQTMTEDGIYIIPSSELIKVNQSAEQMSLGGSNQSLVTIKNSGAIIPENAQVSIKYDDTKPELSFEVISSEEGKIADIIYHFKNQTTTVVENETQHPDSGIILTMSDDMFPLSLEPQYSGNSTFTRDGYQIVNTQFQDNGVEKPGISAVSLEDANTTAGVGFHEGNKHMLLLAAGNTVGESNKPYASDIGIVIGDPTISLKTQNTVSKTGYTKDIGAQILAGQDEIKSITTLDYNNDKLPDIFVAYEDGRIRLLENEHSFTHYKDEGIILNLTNGIQVIAKGDLDNDGLEDLIVVSRESCKVDEVCVYWYKNNGGSFTQSNLGLNTSKLVFDLKVDDMNNDGLPDIITSDFDNQIMVFYNKNGVIDRDGQQIAKLDLNIDDKTNFMRSVAVNYQGMRPRNENDLSDGLNYRDIPVVAPDPNKGTDTDAKALVESLQNSDRFRVKTDIPETAQLQTFIFADADENLKTSVKIAKDDNGDPIKEGESISYQITLINTGQKDISDLALSDAISNAAPLNKESVKCLDCQNKQLQLLKTNDLSRPFILRGIDIPAGSKRTIQYSATLTTTLPKYNIVIGNNFDPAYPQDTFKDIVIRPERNQSGKVFYYYSSQKRADGTIEYKKFVPASTKPKPPKLPFVDDQGKPDFGKQDENGVPADVQKYFEKMNGDSDGDLLPDPFDFSNGELSLDISNITNEVNKIFDDAGNAVEKAMKEFLCGGSCLPFPISISWLSMGMFNLMGTPLGYDIGTPLIGDNLGFAVPPYVCFGNACTASLVMRTYLSPTIPPLNLGLALCLGPYGAGQCFAFSFDLLKVLNLCEKLNEAISTAMAKVDEAISTIGNTVILIGGNSGDAPQNQRDNAVGIANYNLGKYEVTVGKKANYRVAGFPKPLTDWFSKQIDEVVDKLTDLPDIYVILPDLAQAFKPQATFESPKSIRDILTWINSIPILEIETKKVAIKVPIISRSEIDKFVHDAENWVDEAKQQIKINSANIRPKIRLDVEKVIVQIQHNLSVIEEYKRLFRQIKDFRNIQTKYISQVLCYIDAIHGMLVGWVKKNEIRLKAWIKAIEDIKQKFTDWKLLIDIPSDYVESCDTCTTDRFTLYEMFTKLFVVIPTPPIIQLPKWPDIVMDFSEIQAGLKIIWPEVTFQPVPLQLPKLPRIDLASPQINANYDFNKSIPDIPLIPAPPSFPELPNLPPLPVVDLPVLPEPPEIPGIHPSLKISLKGIKIAFKILCLIKSGIIPTQESSLKTKFESLAARNLDAILPIDVALKVNYPNINYSYLDKINIRGKMNFSASLDVNVLYEGVKLFADQWNPKVDESVNFFNEKLNVFSDAINTIMSAPTQLIPRSLDIDLNQINYAPIQTHPDANRFANLIAQGKSCDDNLKKISIENPMMQLFKNQYTQSIGQISQAAEQIQKEYDSYPKTITAKGSTTEVLYPDNPILNRHLSEIKISKTDYENAPTLNNIAKLKNAMLVYAQNHEKNTDLFDETQDMRTAIALFNSEQKELYAALEPFAGGKKQKAQTIKIPLADGPILLAQNNSTSNSTNNQPQATPPAQLDSDLFSPRIEGIMIYNKDLGINERLIDYIGEIEKKGHVLQLDYDADSDQDFLYSYGGDIYLKENYLTTEKKPHYSAAPAVRNIKDIAITLPPNNHFRVTQIGNRTIDLAWEKRMNAAGYEIQLFKELQQTWLKNQIPQHTIEVLNFDAYDSAATAPITTVYAIEKYSGNVVNSGARRLALDSGSPQTAVQAGDIIQALRDTVLVFNNNEEKNLTLNAGQAQEVTAEMLADEDEPFVDVRGSVVVIRRDTTIQNQEITEGQMLMPEDILTVSKGASATLKTFDRSITIQGPGLVHIQRNPNEAEPSLSLVLPNGNYYSVMRSFDSQGMMSSKSSATLLAPQSCSDKNPPIANAGQSEREVPLFGTLTLDASISFDAQSPIIGYYWDLDPSKDSDGDGNPQNDKDFFKDSNEAVDSNFDGIANNDMSDPLLKLGPFRDLTKKEVVLNVVDELGNVGSQLITITVILPSLTISENQEPQTIEGQVLPGYENIPVSVLRKRGSEPWKKIITDDATKNGEYLTDPKGTYSVKNFNNEELLAVKNNKNEEIATINPQTGTINMNSKSPYTLQVIPAEKGQATRIEIRDQAGKVLATTYLIVDANNDVTLHPQTDQFTPEIVKAYSGVHVRKSAANYTITEIPGSDPIYGGGIAIEKNQSVASRVMPNGDIYIYNQSLSLSLKKAIGDDDPIIIYIKEGSSIIAEVFMAIDLTRKIAFSEEETGILEVPNYQPNTQNAQSDNDSDGMPNAFEALNKLNSDNYADRDYDNDSDGLINIEEYLNNTDPNNADTDGDGISDFDELQQSEDPKTRNINPFADIPASSPLYETTKKLKNLGVINGYDESGKSYFRPERNISRAEYTKIMLNILCIYPRPDAYENPPVFGDIIRKSAVDPWYFAYTKEAKLRDFITGYLKETNPENNLVLFKPNQNINIAESVKIILEALEKEGLINLSSVMAKEGQAWFEPFIVAGLKLSPLFTGDAATLAQDFIVTEKEVSDPARIITRGDFVTMAERVLSFNNCYEDDNNNNGIPDYYEIKNKIDDINGDNDGDGLKNSLEYLLQSDPNDKDTDKGGVYDGEEYLRGTNLLNPQDDTDSDDDNDGLSTRDELIVYGTDPFDADTDDGGVNDGQEIKNQSNPLFARDDFDRDLDGLTDQEEQTQYFTNPLNPDTDNGGIGDGVEVTRGTDPLNRNDDQTDPRANLPQGVNFSLPECVSCPCEVSIENKAQLLPGDKVMSAIYDEQAGKVFVRSEVIEIK